MRDAEKRTKEIKIRCTQGEYEALVLRSDRPRLAEWMREQCLGVRVPRSRPIPLVEPALLRQLSGLGNNLNQIARALNGEHFHALDRATILSALAALQRDLDVIREEYTGHDR